jgi:ADP-ribose pyrophosphatase YjhB (NUDIX family)
MMDEVNKEGETLQQFLAHYDETKYRRPSNTVDMILMTVYEGKLKILLVKRGNHPFLHDWALPGGFVNFEEDLDDAVERELAEETHITKHTYFRQLYTLGNADRDPRTRIISTVYLSLTPEENIKDTKAGEDAADTAWFTISKVTEKTDERGRTSLLTLEEEDQGIRMEYRIYDKAMHNYIETRSIKQKSSNVQLAADHIKAINMAMDTVQNRAASTGILFNLLPKECTMRQMQNAYEAVIGHKTDTGNFRRDIKRMLIDTGKKKKVSGKMARLYTFNPMFAFLEENL